MLIFRNENITTGSQQRRPHIIKVKRGKKGSQSSTPEAPAYTPDNENKLDYGQKLRPVFLRL